MMAVTSLEIIDTAIKIGLGGFIGFLGTFTVTKLNHKHDIFKERSKRYSDSLEQVAAHVEEFSHVALKYWALVTEWVRLDNENKEWSDERSQQLDSVKAEYFSEAKNVTVAESKLLLMGLDTASLKLREYSEFLKLLRRKYFVGKVGLTDKDMDEIRENLLKLRQEFFAELALAYQNYE